MTFKTHDLKIAPKYMRAQLARTKNFEIRKNDRNYEIGDRLCLREWADGEYTGCKMTVYVTYIDDYKQLPDYVVLSTKPVRHTGNSLLQNAAALA